jgi:radical SAM superfamily enzyme YgiQ (UPF0313 family)
VKVLLISANTEQINMPTLPLGLASVAASSQKAGHEAAFLDLMTEEAAQGIVEATIRDFRPELIGISVRNIDDQDMENPSFLLEPVKKIIARCRSQADLPIVLGGAGYSMYPEAALQYLEADMGIQGEGEIAFPLLLDKMERGGNLSDVPGLYLPGRGLQQDRRIAQNLDGLPFPEDHLWSSFPVREDEEFWLPFQTRRGCPLNCSYCSTATIEGKTLRKRSPSLVVQEIAKNAEKGIDRFYFVDNTFNLPPSYAKEICRQLIAAGLDISWRCILYPWKLDEELVRLMAKSGCKTVALGFESGCERILRSMNKRFSPEDVRGISRMLADYSIERMGFLLLGGPGETKQSVEESLVFADSLNLEMVKVTVGIRIYPYTALARIAIAEGLIPSEDNLLYPRFYLARGLEKWLPETARSWMAERPNWVS